MIKQTIFGIAIVAMMPLGAAHAATVGFLGVLTGGNAGNLGSFERNFVLTLDYVDGSTGFSTVTGGFEFPSTPNATANNPDVNVGLSAPVSGTSTLTVFDNNAPILGGDALQVNGSVPGGILAPNANQVNFSFTFYQAGDTIDSNTVNEANIALLLAGVETQISFSNPQFSGFGSIKGAPEPGTMIALTGLVLGGCGIGVRRRKKAMMNHSDEDSAEDANES